MRTFGGNASWLVKAEMVDNKKIGIEFLGQDDDIEFAKVCLDNYKFYEVK